MAQKRKLLESQPGSFVLLDWVGRQRAFQKASCRGRKTREHIEKGVVDEMGDALTREEIICARRAFRICESKDKYKTLADIGFDRDDDGDKDWVTPYQKISNSPTGPVLVALHWLDVPSIEKRRCVLKEKGYLPGIPFNEVGLTQIV